MSAEFHEHRWMFLNSKGNYEPVEHKNGETLYRFSDWAYLICNGCDTVVKRRIKSEKEVDNGGSQA